MEVALFENPLGEKIFKTKNKHTRQEEEELQKRIAL